MKDNKDKNKLILSIVAVVLVIILIAGGTYAYWTWTSPNNTKIGNNWRITGGNMSIDGGGDITAQKMVPTASCNGSYAIVRTVKVTAKNETNTSMTAKVNLNLTNLPAALKTANMKYFISESSSAACTTPTGTFASSGNSKQIATFNVGAGATVNKTYYLKIWLANNPAGNPASEQGQSFTITYTGTLEQNAS